MTAKKQRSPYRRQGMMLSSTGETTTQAACRLGVTKQAIRYRIKVLGMSPDRAMSTPKTPGGYLRKIGYVGNLQQIKGHL